MPRCHLRGVSNTQEYKHQYINPGSTMPCTKIFRILKLWNIYEMVSMNLKHYWYYGYYKSDKSQAQVWCLFTSCAVRAHKHWVSLVRLKSTQSPWFMAVCIMPAIMCAMNNTKFWRYVGLYSGAGNRCDWCSSDFPPEHRRFVACEACICQDIPWQMPCSRADKSVHCRRTSIWGQVKNYPHFRHNTSLGLSHCLLRMHA